MENIRKTILTLKELTRCTDIEKVRKLKRKFEDLNSVQDTEKCGMLSLDQLIDHTKDLVNEVEGLSTYGKFSKRIDLDVCKDTRGDILSTAKLFGETTTMRNMEKIYDYINGSVRKIGVYGMGGIGKTTLMKHINNRILKEKNDKFDCVIWVTVSKESSIFNLQYDIACKIDVDLSNCKDTITRAATLFKAFEQKGRYLLILDDLWEGYPLEDVGIPDPDDSTSSNISKLVLTTRSLDVCRSMKCKAIKMDLLSEDEAWSLFIHHVGHDVLQVTDLEPIARDVASECARLPLAIATIGRSMADKTEACEWRDALAKLRVFSKEPGDKGRIVIEQLKFSFDLLENKKFQKCLLYCALYPEDYEIERGELLELLTLEGIIEEKESRVAEIDEGNAILNKLINQCLLEGGKTVWEDSCVKMHDLVRDMALQIDDLHSQYLAISDTKMNKLSQLKWPEGLLKIHISNCYSLPGSPICSRLTTFILCNSDLPNISDLFFQHFKVLKVLNLSFCEYLKVLPDSISNLVNLVGLFLRHCDKLRYVPSLARLKNLRSLEISFTSLKHIPKGLKKLSKLRYLNFMSSPINMLPPKFIPTLFNLRCLVCSSVAEVNVSELVDLKNLEIFYGRLRDTHTLRAFVKHREEKRLLLTEYKIEVFSVDPSESEINVHSVDPCSFSWLVGRNSFNKCVKLVDCTLCIPSGKKDLYLLPKDVQMLIMDKIHDLVSLCAIESLKCTTDLRFCYILFCEGVRELVTTSSSSFALGRLQRLQLVNLGNLEALIGRKKAPCNVFPCLQELEIFGCPRIKVLFHVGLLSNLKNLEKLEVTWCYELEEIIGESVDDDKDLNEATTGTCITLPKLWSLRLFNLPNLKSVCPPKRRLICKSLIDIHIDYCPVLEQRVYQALEDSGEPSPLPSLQPIELKLYNRPTYY